MLRLSRSRVIPFPCESIFALVADVERYPDFLPGWIAAAILRRQGNVYATDQTVRLGPFTERFTTKTELRPPAEILVTAIDGRLDRLAFAWRFRALAGLGCEVTLEAELPLRGAILGTLSRHKLADGMAATLAAFEKRAQLQYGPPALLERDQGDVSPTDVPDSAGGLAPSVGSAG